MRPVNPTTLAFLGAALGLAACADPAASGALTPAGLTGSAQQVAPTGGVNLQDPARNPPGPYAGSDRGSNSPLGVNFQDPAANPAAPYAGSERGSNSPLRFRRDPALMPGVTPATR